MDWLYTFGSLLGLLVLPPIAFSFAMIPVEMIHSLLAARDLPIVARELGLRMTQTRRLPELRGKIDGYLVTVTEEAIEIELTRAPRWHAWHSGREFPPPWGWIFEAILSLFSTEEPSFDFGDATLDRYFRSRSSSDDVSIGGPLRTELLRFIRRHRFLAALSVGSSLSCRPWLGSSTTRSNAISGAQVRRLLPDLLALARALEGPGTTQTPKKTKKQKKKR